MKKLSFLLSMISFCLLVTGCKVKYTLRVNDFNENVYVENFNNLFEDEFISPFAMYFHGVPYDIRATEHELNATQTWKNLEKYLEYSVLFDDYIKDNIFIVNNQKVAIDITFQKNWKGNIDIKDIDSLEFSLYIPYYVSSHNADEVKGDTYTWNINDIEKANIQVNFDMSKKPNYKKSNNNLTFMYIIIGLSVIILSVVVFFYIRNKKANEI